MFGDFVEFFSQPMPFDSVAAMEIRVSGPQQFLIVDEELRYFDHFLQGLDGAQLKASDDELTVDNLGSSGCDGVSIALGGGTTGASAEAQTIAAADHPGGTIWVETRSTEGPYDRVEAAWQASQWRFTPDFGELGSNLYTLELFRAGQMIFQETDRSGPALQSNGFKLFYKKTITHPDGSVETEWCIGASTATPHSIAGGPTIQADMFVMRSQGSQLTESTVENLVLRGANTSNAIVLLDVTSGESDDCLGNNYCDGEPNSVGDGAILCATGSTSVAANDLVLTCSGMPANQFGIVFYGANQVSVPLGNGTLCVGGTLFRLPIESSNAAGILTHALDNTNPPEAAGQISAGQQWNIQCWYRDPAGGGSNFNLSGARSLVFTL